MRNKKYLAWVRTFPCVICGTDQCIDAHHPRGTGMAGGVKPPDITAYPLCRNCHGEFHHIGNKTWEEKYGQPECFYTVRMLVQAVREGVLEFDNARMV